MSREIMRLDDVDLARAKAMQSVQQALVAAVMAGAGYTSLSGGDTSGSGFGFWVLSSEFRKGTSNSPSEAQFTTHHP